MERIPSIFRDCRSNLTNKSPELLESAAAAMVVVAVVAMVASEKSKLVGRKPLAKMMCPNQYDGEWIAPASKTPEVSGGQDCRRFQCFGRARLPPSNAGCRRGPRIYITCL